uniref:Malate synthase n=1 Tax=Odontella aurita TaxID=265563 RepID=A0A6U6C356_9STRA|mmetsp:Transcript_10621/g.31382  ORF Transcript_10621/g.31382 Transcript_10621/m.31382 type:complete len:565 (+) Transcript_10621:255-1949(+)|eukprot:CAMPEP_0113544748 /NCGR_PEP_ID=MMETSP0015_2-20120614/10876_1 /TAXON_ID=2838 /ORGANISM="Odontella" /LENGTH=564 /DNA_ID=CAMNT_0000445033 /DNA_START=203 /DNA_END=1897 /DNA_ORIENTATION=+ /assembly_acc=CAM_ASM_000160
MEVRSSSFQVEVHAPICAAAAEMLTPDALRFVGFLCHKFEDRRRALLAARISHAMEFDSGATPHFVSGDGLSSMREPQTHANEDPNWKCALVPEDVKDRRVEITGPVDRKMVINGLNSGANVYMADFEDSSAPTWSNLTEGQRNLRDAVRGTITFTNPKTGKVYAPRKKTAVLFVRPRGWHLDEAHVTVNGRVASSSLFDFGLYFYHNVHTLIRKGTGPYFYLPKLEGYLEARLWNDVFVAAQQYLGVPTGTIRATVLLETITAAFEMEEILFELRNHSLGLNCGRWDYLFSFIKKFKCHKDKIAPDRSHLTMTTPLMKAYVRRLIYVCHRRGTFAMGGMSAAIPIKNDPVANAEAMRRIEQDKVREVKAGHDGTWVAHPALVELARAVFDNHMPTPNQIDTNPGLEGQRVTEADLLELPVIPKGEAITSECLRKGIAIVLAYTEAWLRGIGCIPLNNAMEDAATAEISRAQIWQWKYHGVHTQDDGFPITSARIAEIVREEMERKCGGPGQSMGKWRLAGKLVEEMLTKEKLDDFLTSVCYPHILTTAYEGAVVPEDDLHAKL